MQEGKAEFQVGGAFFRSETVIVRDLGVLAAAVERQQQGTLRVLDAMAACGVRSLRYALESEADWVWTNDGNPDLYGLLAQNLRQVKGRITTENAQRLFLRCAAERDYYDLVDVDCFGDAMPYLRSALGATKLDGLLYLTSTDGRSLTGHLPGNSLKSYGVWARSHPAAHEQGLRILLGTLQQEAASLGFGILPLLALFTGQTYRVMVRLVPTVQLTPQNYGFLGYCHGCAEYQTLTWQRLGRTNCYACNRPLTVTGPMWLGWLHDRAFLRKMQTLAEQWQWFNRLPLLSILQQEADLPPYFYLLGTIGRRGKLNLPGRDGLIAALIEQGHQATATHVNAQAIKTTASLATCIAIARSLGDEALGLSE